MVYFPGLSHLKLFINCGTDLWPVLGLYLGLFMAYVETTLWLVSWPSCNQSCGLFQAKCGDCLGTDFGIVL